MSAALLPLLRAAAAAAAPVAIANTANGESTTNSSSYSFSGVSIGAAAADRIVVFCFAGDAGSGRTISSVTINGSAATLIQQNASGNIRCGMYALAVPAGTTATLAVTFSGSMNRCMYSAFAITGADGAAAHASGNDVTSTYGVSINVPADGGAIAFAAGREAASYSFTGVTEDVDAVSSEGGTSRAAAHDEFASAQTPLAIGMTPSAGGDHVLLAASWGPP
ncbi:MAG: hypothetical protein AB7F36_01690 [Reyranellaceae bacterium]